MGFYYPTHLILGELTELLQAELDMTDKSLPYIFVLDEQGRIVHRTQGAFTEEKLEAIEEVLMQ